MIKHLVKHGNSWALVIEKPILELLKIDPETPLEIETDGRTMTIAPVRSEARKKKLQVAREKINQRYSNVFKKLAE